MLMNSTGGETAIATEETLTIPPERSDKVWYCLYTRPRHEKSLARACARGGIQHYLPLRRATRRYKSGRKVRWLPLFPGYLFCCADPEQKYQLSRRTNLLSVLTVHPQERLLEELREIRKALALSADVETLPYLAEGKRVRVAHGPFRGIEGIIEEVKRGFRVLLNATFVRRSVALEVDAADVEMV